MTTDPGGDGANRPPVLGSWRAVYAVVLGTLVVGVALLAVLTRVYR